MSSTAAAAANKENGQWTSVNEICCEASVTKVNGLQESELTSNVAEKKSTATI